MPKMLVAILPLALCACAWGGPGGFTNDPQMFADLAKDPDTACIYIGAVPPYFGGFTWARSQPSGTLGVECGAAKITPAAQPPNMLIPAGTSAPQVIQLAPSPARR